MPFPIWKKLRELKFAGWPLGPYFRRWSSEKGGWHLRFGRKRNGFPFLVPTLKFWIQDPNYNSGIRFFRFQRHAETLLEHKIQILDLLPNRKQKTQSFMVGTPKKHILSLNSKTGNCESQVIIWRVKSWSQLRLGKRKDHLFFRGRAHPNWQAGERLTFQGTRFSGSACRSLKLISPRVRDETQRWSLATQRGELSLCSESSSVDGFASPTSRDAILGWSL